MAPSATNTDQALFAGANAAAAAAAPTGKAAGAPPTASNASRIQPDPQLVQYPTSWPTAPTTADEWYTRAYEVSHLLHQDAHIRDRGNVVPYRQVQLLKDSGLSTILGKKEWGGGGMTWEVAYKVVSIVAEGEGSLGQLLGYHLIWFHAPALVGTPSQRARLEEHWTRTRSFLGGAVNPRDAALTVVDHPNDPTKLIFNGFKTFSTGSKVSDVTILEGVNEKGESVFAPAPSRQEGIRYGDEWVDILGMRATQSGSITIDHVVVPKSDALGFVNNVLHPLGPYNTLNLPAIQLVFTSFYLGIARGALKRGLEYTRANTRSWPYQPSPPARGVDEFYIQEGYGTLQARLWASEAQVGAVAKQISEILHTEPREAVTKAQRADIAVRIAAAKVNVADFGLDVVTRVYELQGARSISGKLGNDLAWRDLRTHLLHDPLAHRRAEVGRYVLTPGEEGWPTPTWYS